ncbi:P-loop ATPase, Sll1717 family [Glaciimonas soli]|uniref:ATP-binding protein n=1 Tax=Glaciimonas soli TaxID=2590999 RepID=A0A843YRV9_9BURK|nr:ATP-binding protein [Glaciimonas soli]MQR00238.1 ATP-binding protein [Glaciimonas soli]
MTKILRPNTLGDITAENDHRMLGDAFVPTSDFRTLIESDDRTVVVGRRGTGKSALYYQLQKHWASDKKVVVLSFSPDDTEIIGFRSLLKPFSSSFSLARASTRLLWRYAMLMEISSNIAKDYKLSHLLVDDEILNTHIKKWKAIPGDFLTKCRVTAKMYLSNILPEEAVGDLPGNLDLSYIETKVVSLLEKADRRFVILMDRLDEGYEPDLIGIGIITGLVYASIELNKRSEKIRPVIFLRDNIYRTLAKEDPDYSRNIEGQVMRLHWDWAQLLQLAAARMKTAFSLDLEKDQRIWDRCTSGELQGRDGFKKCLQFTLYRPRDLLSLLNEAFFCAAREQRDTAIITDLDFAAKSISVARLEDLIKEYQRIFPSIQVVVNVFSDGEPELSVAAAIALLDVAFKEEESERLSPVICQDLLLLRPSGILQALYSIGFLGAQDETTPTFTFCHDGRTPDKGFHDNGKLLIHPCYWLGLNLGRNALKPEEAEEINDEYTEIKVQSATPEIRNTKIGQMIAQLEKIPMGREGESEFEHWCLDALRIIFASHLANIEKHPNGAAVQRRDIVGRNTEQSDFWKRLRADYQVRQVIFEVKNFLDAGPAEYRQLQSYLTSSYGKLGFLVTRDIDENLRAGKDLDWVKEMYFSHQAIIVKFPAKYICKLLQKLRSVEKHDAINRQLNALLDAYERTYLGIKSTRRKS